MFITLSPALTVNLLYVAAWFLTEVEEEGEARTLEDQITLQLQGGFEHELSAEETESFLEQFRLFMTASRPAAEPPPA